jgi:hypothetical protein
MTKLFLINVLFVVACLISHAHTRPRNNNNNLLAKLLRVYEDFNNGDDDDFNNDDIAELDSPGKSLIT